MSLNSKFANFQDFPKAVFRYSKPFPNLLPERIRHSAKTVGKSRDSQLSRLPIATLEPYAQLLDKLVRLILPVAKVVDPKVDDATKLL